MANGVTWADGRRQPKERMRGPTFVGKGVSGQGPIMIEEENLKGEATSPTERSGEGEGRDGYFRVGFLGKPERQD